jgi:hypothetical protein
VELEVDGQPALSGVLGAYPAGPNGGYNTVRLSRRQVRAAPHPLEIFDLRAQLGRGSRRFSLILLGSRQLSCDVPKLERLVFFELCDGRSAHSWNESDGFTHFDVVPSPSPSWTRIRFGLMTSRARPSLRVTIDATLREGWDEQVVTRRCRDRRIVAPSSVRGPNVGTAYRSAFRPATPMPVGSSIRLRRA